MINQVVERVRFSEEHFTNILEICQLGTGWHLLKIFVWGSYKMVTKGTRILSLHFAYQDVVFLLPQFQKVVLFQNIPEGYLS